MTPIEHKLREAIINTVYAPGFWQRKEPVNELLSAIAPLWPKPAPTPNDAEVELAATQDELRHKTIVLQGVQRERDQLRAEAQAKQHAIDAAAAQIAQLSAKEGTRHA